jgi:hypothetical protein
MNLGILFLHHEINEVVLQNLESIKRHNPGVTIVTLGDGEPLPGGYSLAATPALEALHAQHPARSSDWLVCSWFEQRRETFEKVWICEWDTYCTVSVAEFYRPVWEFAFVATSVVRQDRDPGWYWFSQARGMPAGYQGYEIGASPFLYLLAEEALAATCQTLIREPMVVGNGELRFATAANRCGFAPCSFSPPGDQITWIPLGSVAPEQRAIWHPVKHVVNSSRNGREANIGERIGEQPEGRGAASVAGARIAKVFALTNGAADWLCEGVFLPSIRACEPDLDVTVVRVPDGGNGDFMSSEFRAIMLARLEHIVTWVERHRGQTILVSDVDILYIRPFAAAVMVAMLDCDLAFQREGIGRSDVNAGQTVIKCSAATLSFFQRALREYRAALNSDDATARQQNDQTIINWLLEQNCVRYRTLPPSFSNTNIGPASNLHSFHTICTLPKPGLSSMAQKRNQFTALRTHLAALADEHSLRAAEILQCLDGCIKANPAAS